MNTEQIELPPDTRQYPHRGDVVRWLDPEWRDKLLHGLTDEQLDQMSPLDKGVRLVHYVNCGGTVEYYGEFAVWYIAAINFLRAAYVDHDKLSPAELFRIGKQINKVRGKR